MYRYLLLLFIALLGTTPLFADAETDQRIVHAIEEQLEAMLNRIRGGEETKYGFRSDDDVDECVPGRPYRLLLFNDEFYRNDLDTTKEYLVTKNEWRIPVKAKGQNRTMLIVTGTSGNYVIVGMGDSTMAQELQMIGKAKDENDAYYVLYIQRLNAYFFVHEADNSFTDAQFIPLASTVTAIPWLSRNYKPYYSLEETEIMVKQALADKDKPVAPKKPAPGKKKTGK